MKILIIGAKGQLGSDCCNILSRENDTLGCDIPQIDIGDQQSVDRYISHARPEVIINCAAYTAVDACETERQICWKVNADGPKHLAMAAGKMGSRLIHISTDYVFDGKKPVPESYSEDDSTNPLSQYGESKLAGEKYIAEYAPNSVILRTAWLYSGNGKNFLKTMLRLSLAAPERELKVVNDQYGSLTWSYTLAQQIQKLLRSDMTGIVHATSEGYSTWYEAARHFLEAMQVPHALQPCTTADYPTPAHRPANSILANKRLDEADISTFVSWQEDADTFVDMYKESLIAEARAALR
ncbi:MAG: dTDP-4-dehydrorhamnose reductase [Desulfoprunum sp.]|nr:dTDP-4-dehydrorhamnose reductase [Desulfoprunum sp.]